MAQDTSSPTAGALATRREWVGLAVLALPTLLLALDISVLYLALPQLSADLDVSPTQQLWIVDIYGFFIAGFLITMGTLGDRIGRRRLLMIGATAFAAASVLAAYSSSAEMLIVTRAVLGIAGATLMPSTLALISNMFHDAHQRTVAISVWMTCFMGGMIVGPLVGGILLENFWWGSVFLLGVPVMVLLLVTAPLLLPEYRDEDAGRLDLVSVVLALAAILPVIYGLKELARDGWQLVPLVAIALGLTLGVVFVRRQLVLPSPLLDMQLFKHRTFSAALSIGLGGGIVMAGLFLLVTLYLQLVEGLSPLRAGLTLVPLNLAMAVATMLTPQLARWIRPAYIIGGGLVVAIVGLLVVTQQVAGGSLTPIVVGFLLACVGIAAPSALGTGLVVGSAPPEKAGSAAGMSETSGEFGIALGVAILGSVGTAVYRDQVVVPSEVTGSAAETASESISGAVTVAAELPAQVATALLDSAQRAFTSGLHVAALLGAALFAVLAMVALLTLRQIPPTPKTAPKEAAETAANDALIPASD